MTCDILPAMGPRAGLLAGQKGTGPILLVARAEALAIDQLGQLVVLTRPEEWAPEPFGEWKVVDLASCKELEMREACWAVELLTCAPANSINAENIVAVAKAFATGVILGMTTSCGGDDDLEP